MSDPVAAVKSYDLFAPEALADPVPLLHRIRTESPVSHLPQLDAYLLTRHADIVAARKDPAASPPPTWRRAWPRSARPNRTNSSPCATPCTSAS